MRVEERFEEWRKIAAKSEPTRYDSFVSAVGFFDLLECKLLQLARVIGEMRRALALRRGAQRPSIIASSRYDRRYLEKVLMRDFAFAERLTQRLAVLEPRRLLLQARPVQSLQYR